MKRLIITAATILATAFAVSAQDLSEVTEIYNNGAAALNSGDKAAAMTAFQKALTAATALGEEGAEVVANCKEIIPSLSLSQAKDLVKAAAYDKAIEQLKAAAAVATEFANESVANEATKLIPQVCMQKGNELLKVKDYAGAAAAFKSITDADPTNGVAALRLGMALGAAGDAEGAEAAYLMAAENGQESNAKKQLSSLALKAAAACLKAKDYAGAAAAAAKSNGFVESAQAYQIQGQALQIQKKNTEAIAAFEKYLELAPTAKNAGQIAYTVGALYQGAGNKAKAKEFYQKASTDPQYGAEAAKLAASL